MYGHPPFVLLLDMQAVAFFSSPPPGIYLHSLHARRVFACRAAVAQLMSSPSACERVVQRRGTPCFSSLSARGTSVGYGLWGCIRQGGLLWLLAVQAACGHKGGAYILVLTAV